MMMPFHSLTTIGITPPYAPISPQPPTCSTSNHLLKVNRVPTVFILSCYSRGSRYIVQKTVQDTRRSLAP